MNIAKLDEAILAIIEKKAELNKLSKDDSEYSNKEKELELLESQFLNEYGSFMEEALFNVHDEFCPDCDVMQPLAYIASDYIRKNDRMWVASKNEGIPVECDDFPGMKARLVLVPCPARIELQAENEDFKEVVWTAKLSA